jgi:Alginate export
MRHLIAFFFIGIAAYAQSQAGGGPTPVTTTELPYPKLSDVWADTSLEPSLSEKFNDQLPEWLRFSGELRERFEGYTGGGFNPQSTDDYDQHRIRLGLEIKPVSWMKVYVQMQDARVWGLRPALPPFQNAADVRQAYVQFGDPEGDGFSVMAGRQELSFGNNRFIGDSWWSNASRSFDAVRAGWQQGRLRIDALAASVVIVRDGVADHHNQGNNLYGLYGSVHDVIPHATLDVFEFWHLQPGVAIQGLKPGHLDQWTTGFRWVGTLPWNLDYRTEMAFQLGRLGPDRIRAWTGHWVGGYTFKNLRTTPRLFVEHDYASGSGNVQSGDYHTFDPIYPSTHDKLGLADQFGWRNIRDLRFGQDFQLARKWQLGTSLHNFWLANAHDALYPTRGPAMAQSLNGAAGTHIGEELDVQAIYTPTRQSEFGFGYGRVFTGEFLNKTTRGKDFNYPYMLVEYVF